MTVDADNQSPRGPQAADAAFIAALEADRAELNQRFKLCSSQGAALDGAAFKEHLIQRVQPIVAAASQQFPERARLVTKETYMVSLELFRAGYWGTESRLPELNQLWEDVLPKLAHLVAREPERVSGSLSNALINFAKYAVRTRQWLDELVRVGPQCASVLELLQTGQVLAWRAGQTLLRSYALETLSHLPRKVAGPALGLPIGLAETFGDQTWSAIIERLKQDRWYEPTQSNDHQATAIICEAGRVGNYRGLGGGFSDLPQVYTYEDQLYVTDQTSVWRIEVDRFGCVLQLTSHAFRKGKAPKATQPAIDNKGTVSWNEIEQSFPYLAATFSQATDGQTLAVTLDNSFHVYLLYRRSRA